MSECMVWNGPTNRGGYGRKRIKGKDVLLHRMAYEWANGPIPDGMCVCHTCDNPPCVNPDHLWLGTRSENTLDRIGKGRTHIFESSHYKMLASRSHESRRILGESEVRAIRSDKRKQRLIAEDYGISQQHVSDIRLKKRYAHVK